ALVGDAAHTTHYSIGAGTALALGDAAFLAHSLYQNPHLETALAHYDRRRRAEIRRIQRAAHYSAQWYENLPRYIDLPPVEMFALLEQRHSRVLPHVPPRLYYKIGHLVDRVASLRRSPGTPA
ncbi:FAD-binding monooxygenase, partial [Nonomuraea sp. NPDC049695]